MSLRPGGDHPARALVVAGLPRVAAILDRIAADIDELASATTTRIWSLTRSAATTSTTARWTREGLACPIGAHIRRVNPRDTITNRRRRRLPYGSLLPEESPDDGVDWGLAVFFGCADLERQFEFVQKEWVNAPKFQGRVHDKDPIAGDHDDTYNMTIQHKPIKKTLHGLPRFTTVKGRAYVLLPGLRALRSLANP